jgi:hypothetical protein
MRGRTKLVLAVAALVVTALAVTSFAIAGGGNGKGKNDDHGKSSTFGARLSGYNETPSLNSTGHATFTATISNGTITFKLDYADLSGPPAVAHVHIGQVGVAGGVSFFLCGGGGKPACPASPSGSVSGTVVAADVVGPTAQGFNAGDLTPVIDAIQHNVSYANMHTAKFPAGEIRGQLFPTGHHFGH